MKKFTYSCDVISCPRDIFALSCTYKSASALSVSLFIICYFAYVIYYRIGITGVIIRQVLYSRNWAASVPVSVEVLKWFLNWFPQISSSVFLADEIIALSPVWQSLNSTEDLLLQLQLVYHTRSNLTRIDESLHSQHCCFSMECSYLLSLN